MKTGLPFSFLFLLYDKKKFHIFTFMKLDEQDHTETDKQERSAGQPKTLEDSLRQIKELKSEVETLRHQNNALSESERKYAFLARTAIDLAGMTSLDDIYVYIGQRIFQLLNGQSIVAVVEYRQEGDRWKMKHIEGISDRISDITSILGMDIRQLEGKISTKYFHKIVSNKLVEMEFDFPGLFNNMVARSVGTALKRLLSIRKMYCIAFQQDDAILGNITFTTNRHTGPVHQELIESFAAQVSNFAKKQLAEEALKVSAAKYRRITENISDVLWVTDLKLNFSYITPSIYQLTGFTDKVYLQMSEDQRFPRDFMHSFRNTLTREILREANPAVDRNRTFLVEGRQYHADGRTLHVSMHISFVRDDRGNPVGIQGITRDITERKKAEAELIEAKEKAEESDKLKTAFLQNLSHEIRTPLNGITGFARLISSPYLSAETVKEYAGIINERGLHLTAIINDIMTIASLETRQEQIYPEQFNIRSLLREQVLSFAEQAKAKGIKLRTDIQLPEENAEGMGDKTKVGQVLNNLLANALKFTREGEIVAGCRKREDVLEISVRDTGCGIDQSKHEIIFQRFMQADENIRRDYGGIGLGLSICRGFVELMGGKIWVESEPGTGSVFYFTIPWEPVIQTKAEEPQASAIYNSGRVLNILIAEDDRFNFLLLKAFLRKINCRILHAENGQEAVNYCLAEPVDIVLMDIKMPVMDGYTAARLIRTSHPHIPVVAQTAHALQSEVENYQDAFDEYLTKPVFEEQLLEVIRRLT